MAFINKVISEVSLALEYLSGVAGVSSIFLICIISLVFLFFIFWFIILLKLRGIRKILIDVSRRMNAISIISRQQSSKKNPTINQHNSQSSPSDNTQDKYVDRTQKLNNAQETNTIYSVQNELQRHGSKEERDKLRGNNLDTANNSNREEISKRLKSDWNLKSAIIKLVNENDAPVSLQDIGNNLSGEYFDGNYSLILNELEQLEEEGLIVGTAKNGKVLFKKKL